MLYSQCFTCVTTLVSSPAPPLRKMQWNLLPSCLKASFPDPLQNKHQLQLHTMTSVSPNHSLKTVPHCQWKLNPILWYVPEIFEFLRSCSFCFGDYNGGEFSFVCFNVALYTTVCNHFRIHFNITGFVCSYFPPTETEICQYFTVATAQWVLL